MYKIKTTTSAQTVLLPTPTPTKLNNWNATIGIGTAIDHASSRAIDNIRHMSEIQTTTTVRTTLPQSVFQSTKVPAWNVSNAREQMEIKM
jgi:hypothetical protein